ncbi:MAG: helix-turn-helix transcriptional regulator [Lachnospiraceae bacterium]|nr:helix-turn-helix transcriptional regulator [Lachnospiraceae bacterium]
MFKINRIGYKATHNSGINVYRPSGSGDYLLVSFKSLSVINHGPAANEQLSEALMSDGYADISRYTTTDSPCFIIYKKNSPQCYFSIEEPFVNDWIHFDSEDEDVDSFIESLNLPFDEPIFIYNDRLLSTKIQSLLHEYLKHGNHSENIIDLGLKSLFYSLSDIYHEESSVSDKFNRHRPSFNEIRMSIYSYREDKKLTVNDYAKKLNLSVSYFQHVYKKLFGVSVIHDIIQSRIEYACSLLLTEYDSINDIARRSGYENPEHFTRQFKEITGYTPKQYRERIDR